MIVINTNRDSGRSATVLYDPEPDSTTDNARRIASHQINRGAKPLTTHVEL